MYLKCKRRFKDGKEHRYWSLVESRRCASGQVVQRPVLYLGKINDSQRESWCRTIEAFDPQRDRTLPLALFPALAVLHPADRSRGRLQKPQRRSGLASHPSPIGTPH